MRDASPNPDLLRIVDNLSCLARFNDEKAWVEFVLTRFVPAGPKLRSTAIRALIRDIHSDWVYKNLEAAADGIIDFKLEEAAEGVTRDLIRIRTMRNVAFAPGWHRLKIGENFEVTLEK